MINLKEERRIMKNKIPTYVRSGTWDVIVEALYL